MNLDRYFLYLRVFVRGRGDDSQASIGADCSLETISFPDRRLTSQSQQGV